VAVVAAIIVESLGLATTATALDLREYNASKRKSDPRAPFTLAAVLVGVYLVVALALTVALDIAPVLATYSPAIFPLLSLVGVSVLALRADHKRRVGAIAQEKAERKTRRTAQQVHKADAQRAHSGNGRGAQGSAQNNAFDTVNRTRQERKAALLCALLEAYEDNPNLGATDAARALGVHRNTIYGYTAELESVGKLQKNGDGWKVTTVNRNRAKQ